MEVACVLIPDSVLADPVEAAELPERAVRALEGVGAAVESERVGEAYFALDGLRGLYEGEGDGVLAAARAAVGPDVRIGVERTRFGAWLAAVERRSPAPVSTLKRWPGQVADRFGPAGLRAAR